MMSHLSQLLVRRERGLGTKKDILGLDVWPVRLCLSRKLEEHHGCVNTVRWSDDGSLLVSGSDDLRLGIWSGETFSLLGCIQTAHHNNIFCAKFLPESNHTKVVSCAADYEIHLNDVEYTHNSHRISSKSSNKMLSTHQGIAMKFEFQPTAPTCVWTTFQDGKVTSIDLRTGNLSHTYEEVIRINMRKKFYSLHFNPIAPHQLVVSTLDPFVRLFDVRKCTDSAEPLSDIDCLQRFCHPKLTDTDVNTLRGPFRFRDQHSVTDVQFSESGELLANYASYDVVLFDTNVAHWNSNGDGICSEVIQQYKGRRNEETFLKEARFYGKDKYIVTGSDAGEVLIWNKATAKIVRKMRADEFVVNGIAPHPYLPTMATCGIDSSIKVFECDAGEYVDVSVEIEQQDKPTLTLPARYYSTEKVDLLTVEQCSIRQSKADKVREEGNYHFKEGEFSRALQLYKDALKLMRFSPPGLVQRQKQNKSLTLLYANAAACCLKLRQHETANEMATKALEYDPTNVKALYRRARALICLKKLKQAERDIIAALEINADDTALQLLNASLQKKKEALRKC